jgi:branched-chain amino acid aminotransferase
MLVFLNGQFVPEEQAVVSVFDRSFLYGDGLFETILVRNGKPFRWRQHLDRLERGAEFLKIKLPFTDEELRRFAGELILKNCLPNSLLRLTLSRGVGMRGYSSKGAERPTLVMSLHPFPESPPPQWKLVTSSHRLPANEPLSLVKSCNKLPQILARAEADDAGADEALLLNTDGFVVEASSCNLFWIEGETICTAPLVSGILSGVTRAVVLEIASTLNLKTRESEVRPDELRRADGLFLSLSSWGVVEAQSLDGVVLKRSPVIEKIQSAYWNLVRNETR